MDRGAWQSSPWGGKESDTTEQLSLSFWLPWWFRWQRVCLQGGRPGFGSWFRKILWSRKEMATTPVFLPGESHGQRILVYYSPRNHKELDTTEWLTQRLILPLPFRPTISTAPWIFSLGFLPPTQSQYAQIKRHLLKYLPHLQILKLYRRHYESEDSRQTSDSPVRCTFPRHHELLWTFNLLYPLHSFCHSFILGLCQHYLSVTNISWF